MMQITFYQKTFYKKKCHYLFIFWEMMQITFNKKKFTKKCQYLYIFQADDANNGPVADLALFFYKIVLYIRVFF
jgi:hypothetical protein